MAPTPGEALVRQYPFYTIGEIPANTYKGQDREVATPAVMAMLVARSGLPDDLLNFHYDPLTCAAALGWEGVEFDHFRIRVDARNGSLLMRVDPEGVGLRVATAVDGPSFNRHWLRVVALHR